MTNKQSIGELIVEVVRNQGMEVLNDPLILSAWLMDYFPDCEELFSWYSDIVSYGVARYFYYPESNRLFAQQVFDWVIYESSGALNRNALVSFIQEMCRVFGIQCDPIQFGRTDHEKPFEQSITVITPTKETEETVSADQLYDKAKKMIVNGIVQDNGQFIDCLIRAAEMGSLKAAHRLGQYYFKGRFVPVDVDKGTQYFMQCIESGKDYNSAYELYCYLHKINPDGALWCLRVAADHEVVQAQFDYALYLFEADQSNWDQAAFQYFSMASEHQHAKALYYMALCTQFGRGTDRSPRKAKEYLEKSALLGSEEARIALSKMY